MAIMAVGLILWLWDGVFSRHQQNDSSFSDSNPIHILYCKYQKAREASVQTFPLWQQSNNSDHPMRSLYYCLFASHIFVCCS